MNSKQRRTLRRKYGMRPPYPCLWCKAELPTWDAPCDCAVDPRPRRPLHDMTLRDLTGKAWEMGFEISFELKEAKPPNPDIAEIASHVAYAR